MSKEEILLVKQFIEKEQGSDVELIETNLNWLLLDGKRVLKFKKQCCFPFCDFSTLEKRKLTCWEEFRLNKRLAPQLYKGVARVVFTDDGSSVVRIEPCCSDDGVDKGTAGSVVSYAVEMVQFDRRFEVDTMLRNGTLTEAHITALARTVAQFHLSKSTECNAGGNGKEHARKAHQWAMENFDELVPLCQDEEARDQLLALRQWTENEFERCRSVMEMRRARDCHGDLHLGNVVILAPQPTTSSGAGAGDDPAVVPFDCLEFNSDLRITDVCADVAFMYMDLCRYNRRPWASLFLIEYVAETGDSQLYTVLRYYCVYRALVRAKVAAIHGDWQGEFPTYERLASAFAFADCPPCLIVTRGLSGSGKSFVAQRLAGCLCELGAAAVGVVRSDVERKRLFNVQLLDHQGSKRGVPMYTREASQRTYDQCERNCELIVCGGQAPAIVDVAALQRDQRARFVRLAHRLGCPVLLVNVVVARADALQRLTSREQAGTDVSDANVEVYTKQLTLEQPVTDQERSTFSAGVVDVDTTGGASPELILEKAQTILRQVRDAAAAAAAAAAVK